MNDLVLDIAGGPTGGAARWACEANAFVTQQGAAIRLIGDGQRLTPGWLVRRERLARSARTVVAANNVSFAVSGQDRRVLLRNALHFLYPPETGVLAAMPRSLQAQIRIVRGVLTRADAIVVPCSAMAERVCYHVPSVRDRLLVRPHPVTPVGVRKTADSPFILVPVVPAPYKNLVPQLRALLHAIRCAGRPIDVRVTAGPAELPGDLVQDPRVTLLGVIPHRKLAELWRSASAAFFPCCLEAFGYPLAEARAYGVPVISPDSEQAREIAGAALRPYDPASPDSLLVALEGIDESVVADPETFDRDAYFRWLFDLPADPPLTQSRSSYERSA
jgi:glycosyltransferase involved in cell wall biosynthesis